MNLYDPCVWNKQIAGKQCMFMYHIDNVILLHMLPHIVSFYIKKLEKEYTNLDPLTVTCGKVHEYLGIIVYFRWLGELSLLQYNFIKMMRKRLPDSMKNRYCNTTTELEYLFKIGPNNKKSFMMLGRKIIIMLLHKPCGQVSVHGQMCSYQRGSTVHM